MPPGTVNTDSGPTAQSSAVSASVHRADQTRLRRRQIGHDIHHELGTIMMLASLLSCATDVGSESQQRARQIIGEARWLDQLHRAYEETVPDPYAPDALATTEPIRLDVVGGEVVAAMKLCAATRITFACLETWAHADRLASWRALRNVLGNAIRAAGTHGHVEVRIFAEDGWAVAQVDDDGPGFGSIPPGLGSLGLGIVQDMATACGGQLEISRRVLGGCCVRLRLPAAPPANPVRK